MDSPYVPFVTLLPGKLHATILALKLFLRRVHRRYVKGKTVISAVDFAANRTGDFVVDPLDVVMNVTDVFLQVPHESEGGRALLALERAQLEVRAVHMSL